MIGLTETQSRCLTFLKDYRDEKGIMPSYSEICTAMGTKSLSAAHRMIVGLEERGAIRRMPNRNRAIEIIPESERRTVVISADLWPSLIAYCTAEQVTVETAVAQFIRDALEAA